MWLVTAGLPSCCAGRERSLFWSHGCCASFKRGMLLLLNFRCKLLHQASSPAGISPDPGTPTKPTYTRSANLPAESHLVTCADPAKVSCKKQLECLAQLYSSCIAGED